MTAPKDGYNSGIQRVELGGTNATTGKWDEAQLGGVVSLGTYLTGERYPTTSSALGGTDTESTTVTLAFTSTDYDDGDQVVISGSAEINGTYTIIKTSAIAGTITVSSAPTVSNTGTITFTHTSRGYFNCRVEVAPDSIIASSYTPDSITLSQVGQGIAIASGATKLQVTVSTAVTGAVLMAFGANKAAAEAACEGTTPLGMPVNLPVLLGKGATAVVPIPHNYQDVSAWVAFTSVSAAGVILVSQGV